VRLFTYNRAGAVVIDGDRVLLASMEPPGQRRWWHFPGGGIEEGETPAEAAVRELFEETGLHASNVRELMRAAIHGGFHHYFSITCDDLELGAVTGPELEYAADADFRIEWVPIARLASMPVFPRCVAEQVAKGVDVEEVLDIEDDRFTWEGIDGEDPPSHLRVAVRAVVTVDDGLCAIRRDVAGETYFVLPGGGCERDETAEQALVREVREELNLEVVPTARLAVVVYQRDKFTTLQTFFACDVAGGDFGRGSGDEYLPARRELRGEYTPVVLDPAQLPGSLRPSWLQDRLPQWLDSPLPEYPERFCEIHD
jgi:8-oxo-dGTP diphosphatase